MKTSSASRNALKGKVRFWRWVQPVTATLLVVYLRGI